MMEVWQDDWKIPAQKFGSIGKFSYLCAIKVKAYAPASIRNVVVDGFAKTETLIDAQSGNNFYCPSAFFTQSIQRAARDGLMCKT